MELEKEDVLPLFARRTIGVCGAIIVLAIAPASQAVRALATGPRLMLSPSSALPGSNISINGSGFRASETVSLYWNGSLITMLTSGTGGSFSYPVFLAGHAAPGTRSVLARGSGGDQASAVFTVLAAGTTPSPTPTHGATATPTHPAPSATPPSGAARLSLSPDSGAPGSAITVSGSGFRPSESVSLFWNGGLVVTLVDSSGGAFTYQVSLAGGEPPGPRAVSALGSMGDQAGATFIVLASSPTSTPLPPAPTASATPPPPAPTATPTPVPPGPPATPLPAGPTPTALAGIPNSGTTSNGCPTTPDQAGAEQMLFTLLNQHRAAAGAPSLALNETLSLASRDHSCDMFQHQNLSHTGSDGSSPFQRIAAVGVPFTTAGENIGMAGGYGLSGGVTTIDNEMMAEPLTQGDHHWNIVNAAYTQVGIGIIYANNQVWLTEDFVG